MYAKIFGKHTNHTLTMCAASAKVVAMESDGQQSFNPLHSSVLGSMMRSCRSVDLIV